MLVCILTSVLVLIAMVAYCYAHLLNNLSFIRSGNEDNFCSFEKARHAAMIDNEQIHRQADLLHQHLTASILQVTTKLDALEALFTNIPSMEEQLGVVSALIRRLPDKDFFQGRFDVIINNQTFEAKNIKDILDISNFVQPLAARIKIVDDNVKNMGSKFDQFVAKTRPLDDMMKGVLANAEMAKKTCEDVGDLETEVYNLSENTKSVLVALEKINANVKEHYVVIFDILKKKPEYLNDLALSVNQIKKELSNTSSSLASAICSSEDRLRGQLKLELSKPIPLSMTELTERKMIDTFIKINKVLLQKEDPKTEVIKKPTKLTPEVIKKIKALRAKGISYAKIGKQLSLSQASVYKVINP